MKLIYISNSRLPTTLAHGLQVMQMCSAFAANGNEVELLVPRRIRASQQDPFEYYGVKRNFKISKLPCADLLFLSGSKVSFLAQLLSFLAAAKAKLASTDYDILYSREMFAGLFFKNIFLEVHSLPKKINPVNVWIWKRARALIVLTSFIKKRLIDLGVDADKILVSPDAVDLTKFSVKTDKKEAKEMLGLPADKKLVGYVGMLRTLGMEKGVDEAIEAISGIKDGDVALVLVGGNEKDINFYKNIAKDKKIDGRVIFAGMVKHDLVPFYLKAFDVLIAPFPETEHYNFFMSPLKIFEYMASDRPVVSTHLPSLEEILNDSNSILVAPGNSSELREAIIKLLSDSGLSKKLAAQALADVQKYTWKKRAENILSFGKSVARTREAAVQKQNIDSFSSAASVDEYSKRYLRPGEEYVIKKYMAPGSLVLDVGCGAGRTTSYISEADCKVVGVDLSAPLINKAKTLYPDIDFRVMDVRKLEFEDNTFDAVFFSFNGLDNLPSEEERDRAVLEMKRVLKPGGALIYSSHNGLVFPRTKTGWKIIFNNLGKLRIGPHYRAEDHGFGKLTQYYNNVWNEKNRLFLLGFRDVRLVGNSGKFLNAPEIVLSVLDKFPIYTAIK